MGDVAEILGLGGKSQGNDEVNKILSDKPKGMNAGPKASKKPKGMSREVFGLVGADGLVPAVQTTKVSLGFKSKRTNALKGKWIWAPFQNSSRKDNLSLHHWVKAEIQYSDYPYSKFNAVIEQISYTNEEYESLLKSNTWTREETDHLFDLCHKYELRWPVILDRYSLQPLRNTEEMQMRYYSIIAILKRSRGADGNDKPRENQTIFNYEEERLRRFQMEVLFRKTKEEEQEEQQLREELKTIESSLKKAKKSSKQSSSSSSAQQSSIVSSATAVVAASNITIQAQNFVANAVQNTSTGATSESNKLPASIVHPPTITIEPPAPGRPVLQSSRLIVSEPALGISKTLVKKFNTILRDLGAPEYPVPTKAVCDLYDSVRKETLTLLSLHSAIAKREKELQTMRGQQVGVLTGMQQPQKDVYISHNGNALKFPEPSENPLPPMATNHTTFESSNAQILLEPIYSTSLLDPVSTSLLGIPSSGPGSASTSAQGGAYGVNNSGVAGNGTGVGGVTTKKTVKRKAPTVTEEVSATASGDTPNTATTANKSAPKKAKKESTPKVATTPLPQ